MMTNKVFFSAMNSPIGPLTLTSNGSSLTGVYFEGRGVPPVHDPDWERDDSRLRAATEQLEQYFAGELTAFKLPLSPQGTPFQRKVWDALVRIPFATTLSYGELASQIGVPGAARAVGQANGSNPLAVIVPCHRVIGSNGRLTGYGGGEERKRWLLNFERRVSNRQERAADFELVPG
jgi:methylated-DNA-[protein]-cysteine S-methyltransferase